MKPYPLILLLIVGALVSCAQRTYSEEDVRKFVVPGTTREAIIERFGEPFSDEKNPAFEGGKTDVDEILSFDLPSAPPGVKENYVFSGFEVRLKNGKALKWSAIHRSKR